MLTHRKTRWLRVTIVRVVTPPGVLCTPDLMIAVPLRGGELIPVPPLGPMAHHPGRARTHPGQPRVPFPPAGAGLSRQPRAILGPGDVVPRLFGGGGDAWVRPRMVNPPGEGVPSGVTPVTLGQPLTPRMGGGELLPVLVDPAYGGSSGSDTAPSMASMSGALALVHIEDVPPPAGEASLQMFERLALRTQDLVTVALTAFGPGQAQSLAPSILETFDTSLSHADVVEHLHLLWAMRRKVAAQVRETLLLGELRREPPGAVLHELLDLTSLYTRDTD